MARVNSTTKMEMRTRMRSRRSRWWNTIDPFGVVQTRVAFTWLEAVERFAITMVV
jgi:hypothetical protein